MAEDRSWPSTRPCTAADNDPLVRRCLASLPDSRRCEPARVARLQAAGYADITAAHHPIFENIDPKGSRLTTLATRTGMTHQSMGELVAVLERNGYLDRTLPPVAVRHFSNLARAWHQRCLQDPVVSHAFSHPGQGWGFGASVDVEDINPWNLPGRYGWVGGTGTTAHITPSTGSVAILLTQVAATDPVAPALMRDFWHHAANA